LWAYTYRLKARASMRPQAGGFASRAEAQMALRKALDRIGPGGDRAITLAELVASTWSCIRPSPRPSRSCAGCSAKQPARSAVAFVAPTSVAPTPTATLAIVTHSERSD
jgi:hypothetical protein